MIYCFLCLLTCMLVCAAIFDFKFQKIPNLLVFPMILFAIGYHAGTQHFSGISFSIQGLLLGCIILIFPYLLGGMGAGDVKLMGAVGAFLGPRGVSESFLLTAGIGGLYAIGLIIMNPGSFKTFFQQLLPRVCAYRVSRIYIPDPEQQKRPKLFYGIAIALGTITHLGLKSSGIELLP